MGALNYVFISFVNGALSITPAALTVSATANRTYGAADPAFSASYSGFVLGQTLGSSGVSGSPSLSSTDSNTSPVGSYPIGVALNTLGAQNYTFTLVNGVLSITPTPLTVMAANVSRAYGAADPAFAVSYSGFVLGQTLGNSGVSGAPSLISSDNSASPVGTYTITPALGTLAAQIYVFTTFNSGNLSVNQATLTVTAANVSRAYGATDPAFTANYSGFVLGQTLGNSGAAV